MTHTPELSHEHRFSRTVLKGPSTQGQSRAAAYSTSAAGGVAQQAQPRSIRTRGRKLRGYGRSQSRVMTADGTRKGMRVEASDREGDGRLEECCRYIIEVCRFTEPVCRRWRMRWMVMAKSDMGGLAPSNTPKPRARTRPCGKAGVRHTRFLDENKTTRSANCSMLITDRGTDLILAQNNPVVVFRSRVNAPVLSNQLKPSAGRAVRRRWYRSGDRRRTRPARILLNQSGLADGARNSGLAGL